MCEIPTLFNSSTRKARTVKYLIEARLIFERAKDCRENIQGNLTLPVSGPEPTINLETKMETQQQNETDERHGDGSAQPPLLCDGEQDNKIDENTLGNMLTSLADAFTAERQKEEPYKEMFKKGSSLTGLLRHLESEVMGHVLDACDVLEAKHGIEVNHEQYHVLLALPLLVKVAEKDAKAHEGWPCSVDKAYFMLSEQLKALGT